MISDTGAEFASVLTPQQVAVGVQGGSSILMHGIRATMEHRRDFVVVKIDLRNAYFGTTPCGVVQRSVVFAPTPPYATWPFSSTRSTRQSHACWLVDRVLASLSTMRR
eukprot:2644459-Prymnesium_polylepis.1